VGETLLKKGYPPHPLPKTFIMPSFCGICGFLLLKKSAYLLQVSASFFITDQL
jgi:hypothetical protein